MTGNNILLVLPDQRKVYEQAFAKAGAFHVPSLAFAVLGPIARENGFSPTVLDLALAEDWEAELAETLAQLSPVYIGITFTTSLYFHAVQIARLVRQLAPATKILIGGAHASSLVDETLANDCFDYLFIGEAEESLARFLQGKDPADIDGLAFRNSDGAIHSSPPRGFLRNLDDFPLPDYGLYDLQRYPASPLHARQNPVVWMETSRGCPFDCKICNKIVHGQTFRPKSTGRVLAEIEHFATDLGIREFHLADDCFGANRRRAEEICDGLIEMNLGVTWSCTNGIRVDKANQVLMVKMRKAGCHRVAFGIESGNQAVLDNLGKGITLRQAEDAVRMARRAGLETFGFFMFGFEDDTEETMADTIRFAGKLPLDLAKASIIVPFPGSPLHAEYNRKGLLKPPGDYRHYNTNVSPRDVYMHPSLDWDVVEAYHKRFFKSFYLKPAYMARRFVRAVKNRTLLYTIRTALSVDWGQARTGDRRHDARSVVAAKSDR